jgi:hypothetical protein
MADNVTLNPGTGGSVIATDEVSARHYQIVKLAFGPDNTVEGLCTLDTPLPTSSLDYNSSYAPFAAFNSTAYTDTSEHDLYVGTELIMLVGTVILSNADATVGTVVRIGNGTSTVSIAYVPPMGTVNLQFSPFLLVGVESTLTITCDTTSAEIFALATGYDFTPAS